MLISTNKIVVLIVFSFLGLSLINPKVEAKNFMELHKGTVKLIRNNESRILKKTGQEFSLLAGDRLQTGKNTNISLYLKNKENTIKLFSNSFFKLEEFAEEGNNVALLTGKGNFKVKPIEILKGEEVEKDSIAKTDQEIKSEEKSKLKFSGQFKKLTKSKFVSRKKRFAIRTVSAVVGVRGTEFVVGATEESTKVLGLSGEVTLASPEVPNYEIPVLANQASHVNEGSGPSVPVNVPPAESKKIVSGEGSEGFNEIKFGPAELISTIQQRLQNNDETPRFEDEQDESGRFLEQLDRLEELESIVENAENAIYSTKQKILTLSVSFTNR